MATFLVTNNNDNGNGSLRQAIEDANNIRGADIIEFEAQLSGQTISLTTGELTITDNLTINGLGSESLTIDGSNNDRVFKVDDEDRFTLIDVSLHDITITNGLAENKPGFANSGGGIFSEENLIITNSGVINNVSGSNGGGIYVASGTVEITDSDVSNNSAAREGGGIYFDRAEINIDNSVISNNTSEIDGGGISTGRFSSSTANITNTNISDNSSLIGGGIFIGRTDGTISSSTISGNLATGERFSTGGGGGGIYSTNDSNITINNSTISGNTSNLEGGGIFNSENYSNLIINNSTITDNTVRRKRNGAGIYQAWERNTPGGAYYGTIEITSTIIAGNFLDKDLAISGGDFTSEGNNLIGSSNLVLLPEDIVGTPDNPINPMLGELEDNGGATQTIALLENSPAIDAGSNPLNLATDQRGEGFNRTEGEGTDIGAFEVQNSDESDPMDNVINGTKNDDNLTGTSGNDIINGLRGNDTLSGGNGNDTLSGGSGNDRLIGNNGNNFLSGDSGLDTLVGTDNPDTISGGSDDDILKGNGSRDLITGEKGNDKLDGGLGPDTLYGGLGDDILIGDHGRDTFIITTDEGTDTIRDFHPGIDLIGLSNGLTFNDLNFNSQNILFNGEIIARLNSIDTESLAEADFISI